MIELRAGRLRCALQPQLGGAVAGLWMDGQPVLRSPPPAQLRSARDAGCHALVPLANRLGHASLVWQGTQHPLVREDAEEPHAVHGIGWQRPWSVLDSDEASAMLACEHRADASWPFAFDCSHTLRLSDVGLEMTLAVTNQSAQPAPMGLGWRPSLVRRAGARLALGARGRWGMGSDGLAGQREATSGLDAGCDDLVLDHCFDGWDGQAVLSDALMRVTVQSELTRLVVICTAGREDLDIAPVSHVINALQLAAAGADAAELGLVTLQPGGTLLAQMRILVEAA